MVDLGTKLREAREGKGISLAEAGVATRIKERYLQALETNDWAALPTQVQARGFLRNYAVFLGLDEDQAMAEYGQMTRSAVVSLPSPAAKETSVPTADPNGAVFRPRDIDIDGPSSLPSWLSSDVFIGVALALVVALAGFGLLHLATGDSNDSTAVPTTTPPVVTTNVPQSTAGAGVSPGEGTAALATATFDVSTGSVQLSLEATEHVWVRVTVDDVQLLEGILAPETPQTWQGTRQIMLETANGAGLEAIVNGQPQGPLGERGQSIILAWGPNGLLPLPTTTPP